MIRSEMARETTSNRIVSLCRTIGPEREEEYHQKGFKRRHFFPHHCYCIPKCGPDAFKLAQRMCGPTDLAALWQISVYAHRCLQASLPSGLLFDDDWIWHQQQLGKPGLVATVGLALKSDRLYLLAPHSDMVQRAGRFPAHRTRIQTLFKGWDFMSYNAALGFAIEKGATTLCIPTSALAMRNTDRSRSVKPDLFERVYDLNVFRAFREARANDGWWEIDVRGNAERLVAPAKEEEIWSSGRTICLCHDIERGLGHTDVDPEFARYADGHSHKFLELMLEQEAAAGVIASYNVVAILLPEVRKLIEEGGHSIAFHSYNHECRKATKQLPLCREIDYRIKGYRPPRSELTEELVNQTLCHYNFEWLASSRSSLKLETPLLENRLVKIPIEFDDFSLHKKARSYEEWERFALDRLQAGTFTAFSLHDCYAEDWIHQYGGFLRRMKELGELKTLNQVAAEIFLASAS